MFNETVLVFKMNVFVLIKKPFVAPILKTFSQNPFNPALRSSLQREVRRGLVDQRDLLSARQRCQTRDRGWGDTLQRLEEGGAGPAQSSPSRADQSLAHSAQQTIMCLFSLFPFSSCWGAELDHFSLVCRGQCVADPGRDVAGTSTTGLQSTTLVFMS